MKVSFKVNGIEAKGIIRGTRYVTTWKKDVRDEPCVYCGNPSDSWEHVIPRSLGGRGDFNRVRACHRCNGARSSKPFLIWMLERKVV